MSFLIKQPNLPQGDSALDPKLASGYKAADVVGEGWGRDVWPAKYVSDKYDVHEQPWGSNKPAFQYCSIAAVYCRGPKDYIGRVFYNGKEITNFDYTFEPGEESHTFTINPAMASGKAWQAIAHRGTEDAPESGVTNLNAKTGQNHAPMRGYAWIEWTNIDLGAGTTALPSLAVEWGTHAPAIGDYAGGESHPYGVNPFAAVYALLTSTTGGDFDASLLDAAHWGAQCSALEATGVGGRTGDLVHCHPNFTASTTLGDAVSQILSYVDGFVYERGQLRVGWFPSQAVDASGLAEITEHDLASAPSGGGFADPSEGATSAVVVFKSYDKGYAEDAQRVNAPANRENALSADPVVKQRPFIHAAEQAAEMAADIASDAALEDATVNLTVLKSRAVDGSDPLLPGDLVNWDYEPHGLDLVCRVIARRLRTGTASDVLTLMRERGAYPRPYVAPVDARVLPAADEPGEITSDDVRFFLLPPGLSSGREITPLINRAKRSIYRADIHLSTDGASPWSLILDSRFFAAKGEVNNAGINASATTVRIECDSVDFERMLEQDAVAQADDTLLLLIDDELMSVSTIAAVSTDVYDVGIKRGRLGTTAASHALAEDTWLFYRGEIASVSHEEFLNVRTSGAYDSTVATKYFKVQLFTLAEDGEAKPDDPGIAHVFPDLVQPPTSLTATAYPGFNRIGWAASVTPRVNEYTVERATNSGFSSGVTTFEGTGGLWFEDPTAVAGTTYYYRAYAHTEDEEISAASSSTSVVTAAAPAVDVTPSNPSAASKTGSDVAYAAADGTIFAKIQMSVPALPSGAIRQELRVGLVNDAAKAKTVWQGKNTSTETPWIDDLVAGRTYYVWTIAWSASKASSAVAATSSPFTITTGPAPSAPTGLAYSTAADDLAKVPPRFYPNGAKLAVTMISWTAPSDASQVAYYEVRSDVFTGTPDSYDETDKRTKGNETQVEVYFNGSTSVIVVDVRAVGRNGMASAWSSSIFAGSTTNYGTGNMAEQNKTAVSVTGGSVDVATLKRSGTDVVVTSRTVNGYPLSSNVTLAKSDVGLGSVPNTDATNASNISSGTLNNARLPSAISVATLTASGDITTTGGHVKVTGAGKNVMITDGVVMKATPDGYGAFQYNGVDLFDFAPSGNDLLMRINATTVRKITTVAYP